MELQYFEPDSTWSAFGIKTQEEYLDRFVVKGKFHSAVHEDVIKSYKTVEYLMAHAFYHYPMYDEALKKILSIFEMVVRIRCKELGIETHYIDQNGWQQGKKLHKLTKALSDFGYPEIFFKKIEWLRELRNIFSHPDRYSFGGGTFSQSIIPIINILNQLFLPVSYFEEQLSESQKTNEKLDEIKDAVFILPHDGKQILGYAPTLYSCLKIGENWYYFFSIIPIVQNPKKHFIEDSYTLTPLVFVCSNLEFNAGGFKAFDEETKSNIEISVTQKSEHIEKCLAQKTVLENMTWEQKIGFDLTGATVHHILSDFMYTHCWN